MNVAHVALLAPPPTITSAGAPRYRDKSVLQRMASDLEPLTFPTRAYVRRSDAAINRLMSVASDCGPGSSWIVVASPEPVDWRRTSYYLRNATAIRLKVDGLPEHVGRGADFSPARDEPQPITSACGLLWMSPAPSVTGNAHRRAAPGGIWLGLPRRRGKSFGQRDHLGHKSLIPNP